MTYFYHRFVYLDHFIRARDNPSNSLKDQRDCIDLVRFGSRGDMEVSGPEEQVRNTVYQFGYKNHIEVPPGSIPNLQQRAKGMPILKFPKDHSGDQNFYIISNDPLSPQSYINTNRQDQYYFRDPANPANILLQPHPDSMSYTGQLAVCFRISTDALTLQLSQPPIDHHLGIVQRGEPQHYLVYPRISRQVQCVMKDVTCTYGFLEDRVNTLPWEYCCFGFSLRAGAMTHEYTEPETELIKYFLEIIKDQHEDEADAERAQTILDRIAYMDVILSDLLDVELDFMMRASREYECILFDELSMKSSNIFPHDFEDFLKKLCNPCFTFKLFIYEYMSRLYIYIVYLKIGYSQMKLFVINFVIGDSVERSVEPSEQLETSQDLRAPGSTSTPCRGVSLSWTTQTGAIFFIFILYTLNLLQI